MGIARRQFLQAGLASLIGWQFFDRDRVAFAAEQYVRQATAATQRKRALLIGINQYAAKEDNSSSSNSWLTLHGCLNDVELQKELLIHRLGFAPQDIVTLTDLQATRTNIANAIAEHLVAQTLPDDLVLIHFSGYGSRLGSYDTLVPVDGGLPPSPTNQKGSNSSTSLQDIPLTEWQSWLQLIATERLINVIDAGFYYPNTSTIGNFRLRSRIGLKNWQPEVESVSESIGVTLRAASAEMLCADAQWAGFSSGAFTYNLVQQLWQMLPATTIHVVMSDLATNLDRQVLHNENLTIDRQVAEMVEIDPLKQKLISKAIATSTFAPLLATALPSGDGAIIDVTGDHRNADLCLAGLPVAVLGNYMTGAILQVLPSDVATMNAKRLDGSASTEAAEIKETRDPVLVQIKSRNGFNAKAEIIGDRSTNQKLAIGQLLQESMRAISRNLKLAIALDLGLSKIERIDATSAFSILPNMFGVNANEQCADCLFGVQSASYGLFTVGHTPILGSFGSVGESVGVAIKRLQPFLESLLAAKLIRATENQFSSRLDVRATLKASIGVDGRSVTIASRTSARSASANAANYAIRTKPINIGDRLECQIENLSDYPLYIRIFCLDPRSKILTPNFIVTPYANDGVIYPQETLSIPYPKAPMNWTVSAPKGRVEVQIVVSRSPLLQVAKTLEASQRQASSLNGLISIPNALQVAQALLGDLDRGSKLTDLSNAANIVANASDAWMLDVTQWTTFNFNYQVV